MFKFKRIFVNVALLCVTLSLVSCGGDDGSSASGSGGANASAATICAKQHVLASGVLMCDEAYATAPFVRLPAATATTDYMALNCANFIDRTGVARVAFNPNICMPPGAMVPGTTASMTAVATDTTMPELAHEHAFVVYQTTLCQDDTKGPCGTGHAGEVASFKPYAVIDEKNMLLPLTLGNAEGKISAKNDTGMDIATSLPVRLTFGTPTVVTSKADGMSIYTVEASIDNYAQAVKSASGACLPALSSQDGKNPYGAAKKASIAFQRYPSMHAPGDDEMVVEFLADSQTFGGNSMGSTWFIGVPYMIATKAPAPLSSYSAFGHGTPGYIPSLELALVKGGGGACPD